MRLAILFRRVGPYHRVRLEAAGRMGDLWCIEGGGADAVYAWDAVRAQQSFRRHTLFPNADSGEIPPAALQSVLSRTLDQVRPQAIAIPGWEDRLAIAALRCSRRTAIPVVVMSDSHELGGRRVGGKEWIKRRLVGLAASGFVAGTAATDYLVKLGMQRERIFQGYDVVDNGHFAAMAAEARSQEQRARSKNSLPERYFLCPGRFIWEKNLPRLLEAYARYRAKCEEQEANGAPWDLVLLGDGPLREELKAKSKELGLEKWVHWPGFRQYHELPVYYGLASAVVLASVSETWGLVVNEAMACGLPVLVSNRCGCSPDLVREGVTGFTFDPFNVEEMARRMAQMSALPDSKLSAFGGSGRELIGRWTPEVFAEGLWKAAETAVANPLTKRSILDRALLGLLAQRR